MEAARAITAAIPRGRDAARRASPNDTCSRAIRRETLYEKNGRVGAIRTHDPLRPRQCATSRRKGLLSTACISISYVRHVETCGAELKPDAVVNYEIDYTDPAHWCGVERFRIRQSAGSDIGNTRAAEGAGALYSGHAFDAVVQANRSPELPLQFGALSRATDARISSALFVHTKGRGDWLVISKYALIAASS